MTKPGTPCKLALLFRSGRCRRVRSSCSLGGGRSALPLAPVDLRQVPSHAFTACDSEGGDRKVPIRKRICNLHCVLLLSCRDLLLFDVSVWVQGFLCPLFSFLFFGACHTGHFLGASPWPKRGVFLALGGIFAVVAWPERGQTAVLRGAPEWCVDGRSQGQRSLVG